MTNDTLSLECDLEFLKKKGETIEARANELVSTLSRITETLENIQSLTQALQSEIWRVESELEELKYDD